MCEDDDREDNDSEAQAAAAPILPAGSHDLVSCPAAVGTGDDEDWFEIQVADDTQLDLGLAGGDASDLDLALYDQDGALIDSSLSLSSDEAVSACVPAGSYLARVFAFGPQRNPYSLTVSQDPTTCAATCEADENEEDDGPAQARPTEIFPDPFVSSDQSICSERRRLVPGRSLHRRAPAGQSHVRAGSARSRTSTSTCTTTPAKT